MHVLITGGRGQLGSELMRALSSMNTDLGAVPSAYGNAHVDAPGRRELDIADASSVDRWFAFHHPYDLIVNCASQTNVDLCERDEAHALLINGTGVLNIARHAERQGAKLVHLSTDYVFSGQTDRDYTENDEPDPLSAYGRTKLAGERNALDACSRTFVVRTSWLYGHTGRNFVATMLRLGASQPDVSVVDDQFGNPTYAVDLVYQLLKLSMSEFYGIYHCSGRETCSWYDFARAIMMHMHPQCSVRRCSSTTYAASHPDAAPRPARSSLCNDRIVSTVGSSTRPWPIALTAYLDDLPVDVRA